MEGDCGREGKRGGEADRKAGEAGFRSENQVRGSVSGFGGFGVGLRGSALVGGVPFRLMFWKLCHT